MLVITHKPYIERGQDIWGMPLSRFLSIPPDHAGSMCILFFLCCGACLVESPHYILDSPNPIDLLEEYVFLLFSYVCSRFRLVSHPQLLKLG